MQRKSIPQNMAAKMNENHRQNTDYRQRFAKYHPPNEI